MPRLANGQRICYYWNFTGGCANGDSCYFAHVQVRGWMGGWVYEGQGASSALLSWHPRPTPPLPLLNTTNINQQVDPASVEPGFFKIKRRVVPPPHGYRSRRPVSHHGASGGSSGGLRPGPNHDGRPRPGAAVGPHGYHGGDGPGMGARSSSYPYGLSGLAADGGAGCVGCAACEVSKEARKQERALLWGHPCRRRTNCPTPLTPPTRAT